MPADIISQSILNNPLKNDDKIENAIVENNNGPRTRQRCQKNNTKIFYYISFEKNEKQAAIDKFLLKTDDEL